MKNSRSLFIYLASGLVFWGVVLFLFWKPFTTDEVLFSGDQAPFYTKHHSTYLAEQLVGYWAPRGLGKPGAGGGVPLHPSRFFGTLVSPMVYHMWTYILNTFLLMLACIYFLRGKGIRGWGATLPALGLAFSGYTFTLISAGHRTTFDCMPYAVFMLAFLDRGVRKASWWHLAGAGVVAGFGMMTQPDLMGLFGLLGIAYCIFLFCHHLRKSVTRELLVKLAVGFVFSLVFFAGTVSSMKPFFTGHVVPTRDAVRGNTAEEKWIFATNWSLPPDETIEFVTPNLYGTQTSDRSAPYWGRLGQVHNWELHKQGGANFRQHTLYMGVIPCAFALFAGVLFLRRGNEHRKEVLFWLGAFGVCLLLSYGRYSPFYHLFYAIPWADKIRTPVKFVHLCEVIVAFLFAFGLHKWFTLLGRKVGSSDDRKVLVMGGVFLFLGFLWLVIGLANMSPSPEMLRRLTDYRLSQFAAILASNYAQAFMHGGVLFLIAGGLFLFSKRIAQQGRLVQGVGLLLLIVIAIDVSLVCKRFIITRDVSAFYADNPIAEVILKNHPHARMSYRLEGIQKFNPLWTNFDYHLIDRLETRDNTMYQGDYKTYFANVQTNPLRLWQLTSTRYILGRKDQLSSLARNPQFKELGQYRISDNTFVLDATDTAPLTLLEYTNALPRTLVYHSARVVSNQLDGIKDRDWDPKTEVLVSKSPSADLSGTPPSEATIVRWKSNVIEIKTSMDKPGILVLNDRFHPGWKATVNGTPAPIQPANGLMRSVEVPAGETTVIFRFEVNKPYMIATASTSIVWVLWGLLFCWKQEHKPVSDHDEAV